MGSRGRSLILVYIAMINYSKCMSCAKYYLPSIDLDTHVIDAISGDIIAV